LPLSNLTLSVPASLGKLLADDVKLRLRDRYGNWRDWRAVGDLGFSGPADDAFVVDRQRSQLIFGNGYTGRVPAPADDFELRLSVGGGSEGNLPAGQAWEIIPHPAWPLANLPLRNVVLARDGSEPESLQDARSRVAGSLARSERVVTERDIADLVRTMNGIEPQRPHVVLGYDPRFPCAYVPDAITVFVVPRLDRSDLIAGNTDRVDIPTPRPDPGVLALLRDRFESSRLLGVRIFVTLPRFRAVRLAVALASDTADRAKLLARIRGALARFLDAVVGGHEQDGWPYGHPLRSSELVRVAQDAVGDEGTVEMVGVGLDDAAPDEFCTDVEIGPHELVYLDHLQLRFKSGPAALGGVL
jgi:predicted phage baseplate assembly protein